MKLIKKNILIGIVAGLGAGTSYAGTISDTYATGDTLTATQLTNIKTEVNGNALDISTNTSDIASNTSDITALQSDVSSLQSPSGSVSVSPAAFRSTDESKNCHWRPGASGGQAWIQSGSTTDCDVVAGVQLPDGVSVTSLTCAMQDLDSNDSMSAALNVSSFSTFGASEMLATPSTTTTGNQVVSDNTVNGSPVVDNSGNVYSITINFTSGTDTAGTQLILNGCSVSYN